MGTSDIGRFRVYTFVPTQASLTTLKQMGIDKLVKQKSSLNNCELTLVYKVNANAMKVLTDDPLVF